MADVAYIPDQNQANNILPWMLASQNGAWGNGLFGGGSGFGAGILGGLLGGLIWGGIGNGGWFGNNWGGNNGGAAAASLGAQATAIGNTETILRAIDGTDADVRLLSTTLNTDVNTVKTNLAAIQNGITQLSGQTGLSAQQIINSIQAGNMTLAQQLCSCCCEMKQLVTAQGYENQLATLAQTNALQNSINGVQEAVAAKAAADQLAMCQQTYALTDTMNRNYLAIDNKIDALESSRKDREITALTAEVAKLESQNFTAGVIQQAVAPINAQLASIRSEVDDIKCKQPSTVSVQYPNLVAVNATPYVSGGFYQGGYGNYYGPGWGGFNNGINF